jgi:lycopene cyclase domain-containing protein
MRHPNLGVLSGIAGLAVMGLMWATNSIEAGNLQTEVNAITHISFFETKWLYGYLLLFTGIFPILFGFIPKPNFYAQLPYVLLANIPVTLVFIAWDVYFTHKGVWGFSTTYTTGWHPLGLPWEEWMFFIIIPMSCTFIYWSLNTVVRKEPFAKIESSLSYLLICFFLAVGIWKWEHIYTSTAFLGSGFLLLYHVLSVPAGYRGRFYLTYLITCIPFLIVNGVLTGGFSKNPVVMYNPEEFFGLRAGTVPVDDFAYSFLMLFANITLFEWLTSKKTKV